MNREQLVVDIRHASYADVPRITEIYNQAIVHTVATFDTELKSAEEMAQWFDRHGDSHPVFVALADEPDRDGRGSVVGWASLSRWSDRKAYDGTAEVSLYVHESFQARGVGRRLFVQLLDQAPLLGIHTLISRIAGENEVSILLHKQFGFEHIGTMREVGLKFGRLLDVHLYQLIFADEASQEQ